MRLRGIVLLSDLCLPGPPGLCLEGGNCHKFPHRVRISVFFLIVLFSNSQWDQKTYNLQRRLKSRFMTKKTHQITTWWWRGAHWHRTQMLYDKLFIKSPRWLPLLPPFWGWDLGSTSTGLHIKKDLISRYANPNRQGFQIQTTCEKLNSTSSLM